MMLMFSHSLQGIVSCWFYEGLPNKSITSLANFFEIFLRQWHYDENDIELFIKTNLAHFFPWKEYRVEELELTSINMENNTHVSEIHDDPIEFVHEEPLIENIVEDPHVTSMENIEDWGPSYDYSSDEDHICTPDRSEDETITKSL